MERADLTMEDWIQETCLISGVTSEPRTFQEAWHCENEKERNNWRTAIRKGMRSMVDREVWRKAERKKVPNDRRLIGNKWLFKIKRDGTYRARFTARRQENLEDKVSPEEHETYRSGVGTLLYLTKHIRPDIINPVRELSKTMDDSAPVHLKEMYKVIRYVLSTKEHGLKFELRKDMKKWALKALSDCDFASDKETRISVFVESQLPAEAKG